MNDGERRDLVGPQAYPVVPFAGDPQTPRRVLEIDLHPTPAMRWRHPNVVVDGRAYLLAWGRQWIEIPADRPVHLAVWVDLRRQAGAASTVLGVDSEPRLEYAAPAHPGAPGQLGAPGTTTARGRGVWWLLVGSLAVCVVLLVLAAVVPLALVGRL